MRVLLLIVIVFTFSYCAQKEDKNTSTTINKLISADTTSTPENTVLSFLKWYKDNGQGIANDLVLNIGIKDRDSTKFYSVNFQATENYLKKLKETSSISDKYVNKWREYFRKCDQHFKNNPTNEGPPVGFDYEFITLSQDDPGLSVLEKAKLSVIKRDKNSSIVLIQFPSTYQYNYYLTKQGAHWQIDDIEYIAK
jgi:hypothetical protein